jgi:hypothetical protein
LAYDSSKPKHVNDLGRLDLCHISGLRLDVGPLREYLTTVRKWLDNNPNEVLTLLLTNEKANISNFDSAFVASGLKGYAFVPTSNPLPMDAWPTVQALINSGKRLVTFLGMPHFLFLHMS